MCFSIKLVKLDFKCISYTDSAKNSGGGPPCANEAATISLHV